MITDGEEPKSAQKKRKCGYGILIKQNSIHIRLGMNETTNCVIVLAAGLSSRFGENKMLKYFRGRRMVEYAVLSCLMADIGDVIVVGSAATKLDESIRSNVTLKINPRPENGISSSIRIGVESIPEYCDSVIISLGDQPFIPPEHYSRLLKTAITNKASIVYTKCSNRFGNPAYFSRKYFRFLSTMSGDTGARTLISDNLPDSKFVDIKDCRYLIDIDEQQDLEKAEREFEALYPNGFI